MKKTTDDDTLMIQYLLGELPEQEQLRVEKRFFSNDEYYRQLLALEDELTYDYAQGGLTPQQRERFERRFLTSPSGRRKVELARAIMDRVSEQQVVEVPEPRLARDESTPWWQSLQAFFRLNSPAMQFSMAAAALVLFLGGSWLTYETLRLRNQVDQLQAAQAASQQQAVLQSAPQEQLRGELERERSRRAQAEQQLAIQQVQAAREPQRKQPSFLALVLSPGLLRDAAGASEQKRLLIPPGVETLRLQLDLKKKGEYKGLRAALQTLDGEEIWSQDLGRARSTGLGQAAVLNLPAGLIPPGDYVILLKGITPGGDLEEIDDYYFSVARK